MTSIFTKKKIVPSEEMLLEVLKDNYLHWNELRSYLKHLFPEIKEEWNYSGRKFGWSFRMKDKKRVVMYLLPREGTFKVAFVFGKKAIERILDEIKHPSFLLELANAPEHVEGRGIRWEVKDDSELYMLKKLLHIKLDIQH
jgi:hypothetical protein